MIPENNIDTSFNFNQSFNLNQSMFNNGENANLSIRINEEEPQKQFETSFRIEPHKKSEMALDEEDYSLILGLTQKISPIHPKIMDTSFPMKGEEELRNFHVTSRKDQIFRTGQINQRGKKNQRNERQYDFI